ncbi:MAG: glycosyltransferase, partial [Rhodospirillales bacterium]|nr:glycosyltransferase [Acetobacter sp.]
MNSRPVRVLYLNHAAKPSGGEIALWRMLKAIDRDRVQPTIVFGEEGPAAESMRQIGVQTHILPLATKVREVRKDKLGLKSFLHFGRLASLGAYAAKLAIFARRHRIQVIHTNTIKAHLYGALVGRLSGLPVVWHLRDYVSESYFPARVVRAIRLMAQHLPRHVVAVSKSVLDQLRLRDAEKYSTVVLDGLTDQEFTSFTKSQRASATTGRPRIGIVGRLTPWKGQHVFLDAAARVTAAGHEAEFFIIGSALFGEDAYEESLRKQAKELGIAERVKFVGFVQNVAGELSKLDYMVHASTSGEPFGQVILEG